MTQSFRHRAGTRLVVEETHDGVLLRPAPLFPVTKPEDVFGSLRHRATTKSLDEMEGIVSEAKRRHARG